MSSRGKLEVIYGPMFSGKTSELLRRIRRYMVANKVCLVLKSSKDNRYSQNNVVTHDKQSLPSIQADTIGEVMAKICDADVIGIDEGQFFPDLVEMCDKLANEGKIVIVAALSGNSKRKPFENTIGLISNADQMNMLDAVCMKCGVPSAFTKRLTNEEEEVVIGGTEKYIAVCRTCYFN